MATIILSKDGIVLQTIPLLKERTRIGRRTHNDVVIDEPGISAEHAVIVNTVADPYFEDLNSTNGSRVNGEAVWKHFLQDGDVIRLGAHSLCYRTEAERASQDSHTEVMVAESPGKSDYKTVPNAAGINLDESKSAAIQILNGHNAGKKIALTQALTTIGRPDIHVAVLSNTERGYALTHIEGSAMPLVNGKPIGTSTQGLSNGDLIDIAGIKMLFIN
jgi:hypothetical protein